MADPKSFGKTNKIRRVLLSFKNQRTTVLWFKGNNSSKIRHWRRVLDTSFPVFPDCLDS